MNKQDILNTNQTTLMDTSFGDELQLYSYKSCDNNSSDFLKQCRGIIFNNDTMIVKNFGYTEEYTSSDEKKIESVIVDFTQWKFFASLEGSVVRLFYFKNKWHISTFKKIDAFKSKFGSKYSFGELFIRALNYEKRINSQFASLFKEGSTYDQFLATLDTNKQYMFLLTQKRVCNNFDFRKIYFTGTFENGVLSFENKTKLFRPPELLFSNVEELLNYVENSIDIDKYQGVICFNNDRVIKIFNSNYHKKYVIRGSEPNIKFRYLQLRNSEEMKEALTSICPEHESDFLHIEYLIGQLIISIHIEYLKRYVRKHYTSLYPEIHKILKELHEHHKTFNEPITRTIVKEKINSFPPNIINRLIKLQF